MKKWTFRFSIGALAGLIIFVGFPFSRLQFAKHQIAQEKETLEVFPILVQVN